jgi:hypothetical protein
MRKASMIVLALVALASASYADDVLFSFETNQGWGSYGPLTTDSGYLTEGSVGRGRFHTGNFSDTGWGIVDVSPVVDLTPYVGMSVDARLRDVPGYTPFTGPKTIKFMLAIGYAEYTKAFTLTDTYQTVAVNFADLEPPIPTTSLNDPALKIQLAMYNSDENAGVVELNYDQVTGLVPEPVALTLWGLGLALIRRR